MCPSLVIEDGLQSSGKLPCGLINLKILEILDTPSSGHKKEIKVFPIFIVIHMTKNKIHRLPSI